MDRAILLPGTEQYQNAPSPDQSFPEDTNGGEGEGI